MGAKSPNGFIPGIKIRKDIRGEWGVSLHQGSTVKTKQKVIFNTGTLYPSGIIEGFSF